MKPHLEKIKLLFNLTKSSNENEAANASALAIKLIEKFQVTDEELQEIHNSDKPIYSDDNLFIETDVLADWKNIIALAVAKKFDCYAIQEENVLSTGERIYKYFVYGELEDVNVAKILFSYVYEQMEELLKSKCVGKGDLYKNSFMEGAANGVKSNIEYENFAIKGMVKSQEKPQEKKNAVVTVEKPAIKPPAIEKKTKTTKEKSLDIIAYFIGESFGKDIHIDSSDENKYLEKELILISLNKS